MKNYLTIAAAIALMGIPALARADDMSKSMDMGAQTSPADKAFMASMQTMMKNMDVKPTGKTDKDFVMMMMPHHQGAIDMAKVEVKYGKDPMLLKMAADIIKAQETEIGEMKAWLAKNGK
ncbi:DUF305 domain-containing protein [Lichenihabitans sp. PAMC28606]|uniref:CopM family metallochaperone n=1 Tax=Lichenihabitans sp. PAMC28606 TaxID=2880932 RepID=UPI001D0AD2DB|nr:DUF305 domain-containing protein [Lichenihabitans sp. PAMC28606]UDL96270.1 DUF305 domain-containing protein [Lichenihabitans sp. PAMC28606]